jgi:hypothetical protein
MKRVDDLAREDWRGHLASLPSVEPPESLWVRIAAARQAHVPVRRGLRSWAGAAIAASLFAVWLLPRFQVDPVSAPGTTAPAVAAPSAVDRGLKQVDDELALAYARNAGEAELAALWEVRERLLARQDASPDALLARL